MGIGKMCLVLCILLISMKKRNKLRFSCISDLHFVTLAAYSVKDIAVFGDGAAGVVFRETLGPRHRQVRLTVSVGSHLQGGPKSKPQTFVCISAKY